MFRTNARRILYSWFLDFTGALLLPNAIGSAIGISSLAGAEISAEMALPTINGSSGRELIPSTLAGEWGGR